MPELTGHAIKYATNKLTMKAVLFALRFNEFLEVLRHIIAYYPQVSNPSSGA